MLGPSFNHSFIHTSHTHTHTHSCTVSGIYIKNHAHILTDNETATQLSTDTDYTYLPVSDTNTDYEESNLTRNPLFHSNNDIITGAILTEDQVLL